MVHLVLLSVVLISAIDRKYKKLSFLASFIVLYVFSAIRYNFGNDYVSYFYKYNSIKHGNTKPFKGEVLFTFLNQVSPSFYFLIALTSLIFIYGIYKLIKTSLDEEYYWIALAIFLINPYLYLVNLSALRQSIAMVIYIAAVYAARKNRLILFIALIFVAFFVHKSAILLLPTYFLCSDKPLKKSAIPVILAVLVLLFFFIDIGNIVKTVIAYFDDANYNYYVSSNLQNSLRATLLTSVYFIYILFNLPKLDKEHVVYGKLYLVSLALGILAFRLSMLTRFQMYFDIFSVVAIPSVISIYYSEEPVLYAQNNKLLIQLELIANKYVFPILIVIIYILRYYSFFTNELWSSFRHYSTILDLL